MSVPVLGSYLSPAYDDRPAQSTFPVSTSAYDGISLGRPLSFASPFPSEPSSSRRRSWFQSTASDADYVAADDSTYIDYSQADTTPAPSPEQRADDIQRLARRLSRTVSRGSDTAEKAKGSDAPLHPNPFEYEAGSLLDPFSDTFDARAWVRSMAASSRDSALSRLSGVAYRDLSVHGFGSDSGGSRVVQPRLRIDYQRTVGNLPLSMVSGLWNWVTGRRKKVQILQGLDGFLEAGEMLVVLGPPGSGCTTFLKTIAGEMNGLYLDRTAQLNYRGGP